MVIVSEYRFSLHSAASFFDKGDGPCGKDDGNDGSGYTLYNSGDISGEH